MLKLTHIKALLLFVPSEPVADRPFLNGLTITADYAIGASSPFAAVIRGGIPGLTAPLFVPVEHARLITGDVLAAAVDGRQVTLLTSAGMICYETDPVKTSDMSTLRCAFPTTPSGYSVQFNPDLVRVFEDAAELLTGARRHIMRHGGQSAAAIISIPDFPDFFGALMPRKVSGEFHATRPEWFL
jgi:hypothetical protein